MIHKLCEETALTMMEGDSNVDLREMWKILVLPRITPDFSTLSLFHLFTFLRIIFTFPTSLIIFICQTVFKYSQLNKDW